MKHGHKPLASFFSQKQIHKVKCRIKFFFHKLDTLFVIKLNKK